MPFIIVIKIIVPANHRERTINAFCSLLSFCYQIGNFQAENPLFMRFFKLYDLFPLYCSGGFTCYIIDYSVDMFYFIYDAVGDSA